jgi:hypothetical protein
LNEDGNLVEDADRDFSVSDLTEAQIVKIAVQARESLRLHQQLAAAAPAAEETAPPATDAGAGVALAAHGA